MPHYLIQNDNYSCAPIAFINLLKWGGFKLTRKWKLCLQILLDTDPSGTADIKIQALMQFMSNMFHVYHIPKINLTVVKDVLLANACIFLTCYNFREDVAGHCCLITKFVENKFHVINGFDSKKLIKISPTKLNRHYLHSHLEYPDAYIVFKK